MHIFIYYLLCTLNLGTRGTKIKYLFSLSFRAETVESIGPQGSIVRAIAGVLGWAGSTCEIKIPILRSLGDRIVYAETQK